VKKVAKDRRSDANNTWITILATFTTTFCNITLCNKKDSFLIVFTSFHTFGKVNNWIGISYSCNVNENVVVFNRTKSTSFLGTKDTSEAYLEIIKRGLLGLKKRVINSYHAIFSINFSI